MYYKRLGKIVEFFPETQSATIQLLEQSIFSTESSNFNAAPIAPLEDVPVEFPKVGGFSVTLPVLKDDICIVEFTDKGISQWVYEGKEEYAVNNGRPEPAAFRQNSINDAIARVGLSNFKEPITEFQADDMELRNTDRSQRISMKADKTIEIVSTNIDEQNAQNSTESIITITPTGNVTVRSTELVTVECKNMTATVEENISASCKVATLNATDKVDITTPKATFSQDVDVKGKIRVEGDLSSGGDLSTDSKGSYNGHKHKPGTFKDGQSKPVTGTSGAI